MSSGDTEIKGGTSSKLVSPGCRITDRTAKLEKANCDLVVLEGLSKESVFIWAQLDERL